MTGPHRETRDAETRPISVAELLARHGTIGSPPVTGRRRRRRGNSDAVTVAELTGEIPVIRDDDVKPEADASAPPAQPTEAADAVAEPAGDESTDRRPPSDQPADWSAPERRWPKVSPQSPPGSGPEHSHYPRPAGRSELAEAGNGQDARRSAPGLDAEQMSPDPIDNDVPAAVDVLDTDVDEADWTDVPADGTGVVRSYLRGPLKIFHRRRGGDDSAGEAVALLDDRDDAGPLDLAEPPPDAIDEYADDYADDYAADSAAADDADIDTDLADEHAAERSRWAELWSGGLIVLQSILAVIFGAGLFIAFDQLWRWNNIVALVLTVLVTLGLVAAVQAVRRTVDVGSTLIAVAVGLLITLGPLALHAN